MASFQNSKNNKLKVMIKLINFKNRHLNSQLGFFFVQKRTHLLLLKVDQIRFFMKQESRYSRYLEVYAIQVCDICRIYPNICHIFLALRTVACIFSLFAWYGERCIFYRNL